MNTLDRIVIGAMLGINMITVVKLEGLKNTQRLLNNRTTLMQKVALKANILDIGMFSTKTLDILKDWTEEDQEVLNQLNKEIIEIK